MSGMGNLFDLMKNAKQAVGKAKEIQAGLIGKTVQGAAGADMVVATVNGIGELVGLKIDKSAITPDDPEMLSDLIIAAVADARQKADQLRADAMREVTGGIDLSSLGIELPGF